MTKQEVYDAWAPSWSDWSTWAKPVLFAYADLATQTVPGTELPSPDVSWVPAANGSTALVVDLPGDNSGWFGLALAKIGYVPVPLYNAIPAPDRWYLPSEEDPYTATAVVEVGHILSALVQAAPVLASLQINPNAPPAFLLDANRRLDDGFVGPGQFDNRSVSLPTDFPSSNRLLSRGIEQVLLIQQDGTTPQPDLAHTLRRWQDSGIQILSKSLADTNAPVAIDVVRPSRFRMLFYNALATMGLRRSFFGGFGGILPLAAAG
jgi:hypothetical protein